MTDASPRPRLMTRLAAALRGEVSADTVEAYRRAGVQVYEDLLAADAVREQLALDGTDLWSAPAGTRSQLLCTWNAYALQTLGDSFITADYAADPQTVGFLPLVTAEQAARLLGEVEYWSSGARRAAADSGFDALAGQGLPAPLPPWVEVEPCPLPHLEAMLAAGRGLREKAEHALADFRRTGAPDSQAAQVATLAGLAADAGSALDYAIGLFAPGAREEVHQRAETSVRRSIEAFYRLGQLLAAPHLLNQPEVKAAVVSAGRMPALPGQPGFDPWVLTDPRTRVGWQRDPQAVNAIQTLWRYDPDPAATLSVQAQIDAAQASGHVKAGVTGDGRSIGNFFCCPWSAIYLVRRPIALAGRRLRAGEQFTFDVSAEEVAEGGEFKRELLVGPFSPTNDIDYCDPTAGGHQG